MTTAGSEIWRPEDGHDLKALSTSIQQNLGQHVYRPEILDAIDATIDALYDELRSLSLDIHGECDSKSESSLGCRRPQCLSVPDHPELKFEEKCDRSLASLK